MKFWLTIAALNGFIAVAAGAFGAHGLEGRVDARALAAFETGARYHMFHALALLAVAWLASLGGAPASTLAASTLTASTLTAISAAGWAFVLGIVLFSGSLYYYGLTESRALVMLTPLGGLAFLAGWVRLAWAPISLPK